MCVYQLLERDKNQILFTFAYWKYTNLIYIRAFDFKYKNDIIVITTGISTARNSYCFFIILTYCIRFADVFLSICWFYTFIWTKWNAMKMKCSECREQQELDQDKINMFINFCTLSLIMFTVANYPFSLFKL